MPLFGHVPRGERVYVDDGRENLKAGVAGRNASEPRLTAQRLALK